MVVPSVASGGLRGWRGLEPRCPAGPGHPPLRLLLHEHAAQWAEDGRIRAVGARVAIAVDREGADIPRRPRRVALRLGGRADRFAGAVVDQRAEPGRVLLNVDLDREVRLLVAGVVTVAPVRFHLVDDAGHLSGGVFGGVGEPLPDDGHRLVAGVDSGGAAGSGGVGDRDHDASFLFAARTGVSGRSGKGPGEPAPNLNRGSDRRYLHLQYRVVVPTERSDVLGLQRHAVVVLTEGRQAPRGGGTSVVVARAGID